ncbi:hypothetical protein WKW79_11850 [Variovorax robiniae]|uniref:Uncharacterized protein n=1 Tax=Variovorax robiniae TaxID=1836199 RepID=A0ABU8X656_9BURK
MKSIHSLAFACVAIGSLLAAPVAAQPDAVPASGASAIAAADQAAAFVAMPADEDTLSASRGGAQTTNEATLTGTTADNYARNVNTGSNSIGGGSFENMSGLPVVIQNTGANVLIQNSMILNLQMN